MPSVRLTDMDEPIAAAVLVVATHALNGVAVPAPGAEPADALLGGRLGEALSAARATGAAEEVVRIATLNAEGPELIVCVGLGDLGDAPPDPDVVRRAVGAGFRSLAGTDTVALSVGGGQDIAATVAAAQGAALGSYAFNHYRTGSAESAVATVLVVARPAAGGHLRTALERAEVLADAVRTIRDQVNLAPADLYPQSFADQAAEQAQRYGCEVEVLDEQALAAGGFGGLLGVGGGSARPPRLVHVSYRPAGARAVVALVGKGITFDTGGYNLKIPAPVNMKSDMAGAATMVAAVVAAARLGLPIAVEAWAAMAQNVISGTSYLPSDVLTIRGGRTVEVANTDAEGRLVLADAMVRAAEDDPDYLVEMSTLTAAQMVALGTRTAGVMGSDELRAQVVRVAAQAGEPMWAMPLPPELRHGIDSPVADLKNVAGDRHGGMLVAGHFLAEFVPAELPWAHIDIAGPSWNAGDAHGYTPVGGTGYGLRSIVALLEEIAGPAGRTSAAGSAG